MRVVNLTNVAVCVTVLAKYHWGFGVTIEHQRWFWWLQFPSWLSPPHLLLCLTLTLASAFTLCDSDTVCYTSRMPECTVPTSAGTGDVWSIPLSPGNRHVRSPPLGADAFTEGREWVETSSFFIIFFSYQCTNKQGHILTQGLSMKLLVLCVRSCNKSSWIFFSFNSN